MTIISHEQATEIKALLASQEKRLAKLEAFAEAGRINEFARDVPQPNPAIIAAAQAAIAAGRTKPIDEVIASIPDEQPPFKVGDVVECLCPEREVYGIEHGERIEVLSVDYSERTKAFYIDTHKGRGISASRFRLVTPAPSPASVASEPTPGADDFDKALSALYAEYNSTHWRDRVDANLRPVFAKLRAENERLRDERDGLIEECNSLRANYDDLLQERDNACSQLTTKVAELATLTRERDEAIERIHPAECRRIDAEKALNDEIIKRMELEKQLTTSREAAEAAEAMEALESGKVWRVESIVGGFLAFATNGSPNNFGPTPTAAILAAKAACGTTKGGE